MIPGSALLLKRRILQRLACAGCIVAGMAAQAQTVPDAARIDQLEKRLQQPALPEALEPVPEETAPVFHSVAPKGAEKLRFVLKEMRIEGATVYTPEQLAAFYNSFIGQEISVAEVYAIADAI